MGILWFLHSDGHLLSLPLSLHFVILQLSLVLCFLCSTCRVLKPGTSRDVVSLTEDLGFAGGSGTKIMAEGDLNIHCCFASGAENKCLLT